MKHPETDLQIACVRWFNAQYGTRKDCKLHHSPNGGKRNIIEARRFKAMGVLPGFPDLILLHRGESHFFELKSKTGTLSQNQKEFGNWLLVNGFSCILIKSLDEFMASVKIILK